MKPGRLIGLAITIAILGMIAYAAGIPVMLLTLAFISGAPLFTIMLAATVLGAWSGLINLPFDAEFDGNVVRTFGVFTGDQAQVMSTIPLFIYAGYLLAEAGTADRLVRFSNALLGWVPGGLAIVTIGTCALFTVFTGASGVTIIALGGVLMPALVRQGYPQRFSMGLIAGTGSVGLLFPPALPLFIYGAVYGLTLHDPEAAANWDTQRFVFAGIVPGLVLIGMLSAVAVTVAVMKRLPRQKFDLRELGASFLLALPELFIPFGVIIGLIVVRFGLPEIAALTVLYTVVLEVGVSRIIPGWGKPLHPRVLWTTSREAMAMVGAILIIIFASTALTDFMINAQIPQTLVAWTKSHVESKIVFLLAINVILLIVGTVMDIFSAIVVVLPLIAPIARAYGVDPYHLGVIFLLNLEVGYLHPPVGLNLFITSVKFQRPITEVMWATIPFLITMIAALLIVTYVPALTVVPEAERTEPVNNLVVMVHAAVEEGRATKDITLVDAAGSVLKDAKGQPMVRHISECATITDEAKKDVCQALFFDVSACKATPDARTCTNKKIADWVVANLNGGLDPSLAVITVSEVPLVDASGQPVKDKKTGQPIVKHLAECDKLKGSYQETCKELFINVSSCHISPPDVGVEACSRDKSATWVDANLDADSP